MPIQTMPRLSNEQNVVNIIIDLSNRITSILNVFLISKLREDFYSTTNNSSAHLQNKSGFVICSGNLTPRKFQIYVFSYTYALKVDMNHII